jgi:hypothetical protein
VDPLKSSENVHRHGVPFGFRTGGPQGPAGRVDVGVGAGENEGVADGVAVGVGFGGSRARVATISIRTMTTAMAALNAMSDRRFRGSSSMTASILP